MTLPDRVDRLKSLVWRGFFWANVEYHLWILPFWVSAGVLGAGCDLKNATAGFPYS